jgi:hypothetical protein
MECELIFGWNDPAALDRLILNQTTIAAIVDPLNPLFLDAPWAIFWETLKQFASAVPQPWRGGSAESIAAISRFGINQYREIIRAF